MQDLIDCDILEYCFDAAEERRAKIDHALNVPDRPVYAVSVLELCRAFHLLTRLYGVNPGTFKACWVDLVEMLQQNDWDGYVVHVCEYSVDRDPTKLPFRIRGVPIPTALDDAPCEDNPERYWDRHLKLVKRLRQFHITELSDFRDQCHSKDVMRWQATPPVVRELSAVRQRSAGENNCDVVLDTNNLLELLNHLPRSGEPVEPSQVHLPSRLSDRAVRRFRDIIGSRGMAGKLIVPLSALEEADHIARGPDQRYEIYEQSRGVLESLSYERDKPLWNIRGAPQKLYRSDLCVL